METNTKIYIPPPSVQKDEITISGDKEGVAVAKDKILRIYKEKERRVTAVSIEVKKSEHKYVTGPKGHALQEIFASTGVSVEMPPLESDTEAITLRGEPDRLSTALIQVYDRANRRANTEGISLAPSFGQLGRGISAELNNSSQKQDQPKGNRYSALSGADMPPSQTYDARRSSSACASTGNGRSGSTTLLSNSTAQTESSTIQCKSRQYKTHLQVSQSSPSLQEMTEKFMDSQKETQKEPEVVLLRADRETVTESRASKIKEISDRVPENIENMVERKTGNENTVDPDPVEQIKSDNMDSGLDNSPNRVVDTKSLDSYVAHAVNSEKTEKKVEWLTDTKKAFEPLKKKSSKQRFKEMNKKETGGDLMNAYTDKPPPQERVVENRVKPVELFPEQSDKPLEEDLSWEDEGENIADENKMEKENDTEPAAPVKQTRRKYERDFLLQLQYMPLCTTKPAGLPDIEIVLDAPVQQGKQSPKKLKRKVMAILDKLTPQTLKTSAEQIMALNIDTPERLAGVVDRIFEKAISEPASSVVHANICRCLFEITVADVEGEHVSFRKLLLNRCQKEFEKENVDKQALLWKYNQPKGLSGEERKVKREGMDEALAKNKRRALGNIKFIGELFKLKLLTENIMHDCIYRLLRAGDEESLESMCMLMFMIGKDLDREIAKPRMKQYFDHINKIIVAEKVSSRVIFMLRDVIELRQNNWVPLREEHYGPPITEMKTMQERRLTAQQQVKDNKQKKGGPGGQDNPKPISNNDGITNNKVSTEQQLHNQTSYPVQTVMMQGQRQVSYIAGHPMEVPPRSMRSNRAIYSSSPQGHSPMQGYIQPPYMQIEQDQYDQPAFIPPNVQQEYQTQRTTWPFQEERCSIS
ncbi:eukaryotic translation initiation factor 4 gamma 1 isoform X1 [Paramuricea clavata]|uniref:Eukaryotic translation initiation factor 4 gamma 1 isoform X1 n=1 Tax=Paramuricea clavata TaxID=317549 RepID=A0A6S7JZC3_PARCT|nr:eukaryotic translation initiation factor 4 gamma 1 isoform X1 [Paramuricea clavata]